MFSVFVFVPNVFNLFLDQRLPKVLSVTTYRTDLKPVQVHIYIVSIIHLYN